MNLRLVAVICAALCFWAGARCNAAEEPAPQGVKAKAAAVSDWIVSSTFKALAKAYIFAMDLEKVKKSNREQISQMDDDSFRWKYSSFLRVIGESPELAKDFSLDWMMDRREAVRQIDVLTKDRLSRMVDDVPDKVIVTEFNRLMSAKMDQMKGKDLTGRISHVWDAVTRKIGK